jgi:hypothetical protein
MTEVALRCEGAVMRFGGLTALDHVSSEWVIVLDYGRKIAEGRFDDVRRMKAVQEAYLGRPLDA